MNSKFCRYDAFFQDPDLYLSISNTMSKHLIKPVSKKSLSRKRLISHNEKTGLFGDPYLSSDTNRTGLYSNSSSPKRHTHTFSNDTKALLSKGKYNNSTIVSKLNLSDKKERKTCFINTTNNIKNKINMMNHGPVLNELIQQQQHIVTGKQIGRAHV